MTTPPKKMFPENNYAFQRADGTQAVGHAACRDDTNTWPGKHLPDTLVYNATSMGHAVENEIMGKRLFLRTLAELLQEQGLKTDPTQAFADIAHHFGASGRITDIPRLYGSQVLCSLHAFEETPLKKKKTKHVGPPETTTKYGFQFFPESGTEQDTAIGYYALDAQPGKVLQSFRGKEGALSQYLDGFIKMAELGSHDYIHQLISTSKIYAGREVAFPRVIQRWNRHIEPLEDCSLAIHAQVCHRLFGEGGTPERQRIGRRRKDVVLRWAAEQFELLGQMQDTAMANAWLPAQQEEVREAITYFAEIYAHRLFRVISPEDPDWKRTIPGKGISVEEAAAGLQLVRHQRKGPDVMDSGLGGMQRLCETFLEDTYARCHTATMIDIKEKSHDFGLFTLRRKAQATPLDMLDRTVRAGVPRMKREYEQIENGSFFHWP